MPDTDESIIGRRRRRNENTIYYLFASTVSLQRNNNISMSCKTKLLKIRWWETRKKKTASASGDNLANVIGGKISNNDYDDSGRFVLSGTRKKTIIIIILIIIANNIIVSVVIKSNRNNIMTCIGCFLPCVAAVADLLGLWILRPIKHEASAVDEQTDWSGEGKWKYGVAAAFSSVRRFLAPCRTSFRQPANGLSPLRSPPPHRRLADGRPTGLLAAATSHTRCRCRVLFLTRLAARPTVARAPRRPCTVDEFGRRSAGGRAPFRHRTRDRPYRIRRLVRAEPKYAFCASLDGRRPGRGPNTCFVSYLM